MCVVCKCTLMCVCAHAGIKSQSLPAGRSPVCPSVRPGEVPLCDSCGCQGTLPSTVCCSPPIPPSSPLLPPLPPPSTSPPPPPPHSCLLSCVHWPSAHSSEHVLFISHSPSGNHTRKLTHKMHMNTVCVPTHYNGHTLQMKSHTHCPGYV